MDAKSLREAMKEKAKRLSGATSGKVDASTFTPAEPLNADVKTGMRPISRRAFKVGGKVEGAEAMTHAGRKPRQSGGKAYADALVNRNVKDANEEREGKKHVGGFAKGGAPEYNEESVEKAIQSSRQKIGKKEASTIHSLLKGRKASMPMKDEDDDGKMGFKKGGRIAKQIGGMSSSPRPMPRPTPEMRDEMGTSGMASSPRPMARPSADKMKAMMQAADDAKSMEALERANLAAQRDQYDLKTLGRKRGGKTEKFEGSAKDEMQDKKLAAKRGMSMKEWEASKADDKHDKQESMKGLKSGGKAMHHTDCMCRACGGAAMGKKDGGGLYANIHAKRERGEKMRDAGDKGAPSAKDFKDAERTARKSGGKVGKSNISINIFPHNAEKAGAMPVPPAGMPPMPPMGAAPMMRPPMPAPMPSAPPPAHMSLPPGLMSAMSGAAGAGAMPPAGGPPMPPPMMGRKAGGKVVYPITGGAGGGRARKEKIEAYGEKMNKDLKK